MVRWPFRIRGSWCLLVGVLLASCGSQERRQPAIGEVYAGPLQLNIRKELAAKSPVTATVTHGERLEVLETRRRFLKVRTASGVEGWAESSQLLAPRQMDELRRTAEQSARLPNQGNATVFEALNVHTEPNRQAPSFYQIAEKETVQIIGHRLMPRVQPAPSLSLPPPVTATANTRRKSVKKSSKESRVPPPPMPPAPPLPKNWLDLSQSAPPEPDETPTPKPDPKPAVPAKDDKALLTDDWSLIRTKDGKAGWVLMSKLILSIPDEVAQYAEGRRITSYFALGDNSSDGQVKKNWLWTTIGKEHQPYDYDNFRVFVWSTRHKRYETAYFEKNLRGYYPTEVRSSGSQQGKDRVDESTFSVIVEDNDGKLIRKTYAFASYHVRMIAREPYTPGETPVGSLSAIAQVQPPPKPEESISDKTRKKLQSISEKLIGKH